MGISSDDDWAIFICLPHHWTLKRFIQFLASSCLLPDEILLFSHWLRDIASFASQSPVCVFVVRCSKKVKFVLVFRSSFRIQAKVNILNVVNNHRKRLHCRKNFVLQKSISVFLCFFLCFIPFSHRHKHFDGGCSQI